MSPPTYHFHHCAVIFSHSMMKVLYRTSRPFSNSFFYDDLSKRRTVLFVGSIKIIKQPQSVDKALEISEEYAKDNKHQ